MPLAARNATGPAAAITSNSLPTWCCGETSHDDLETLLGPVGAPQIGPDVEPRERLIADTVLISTAGNFNRRVPRTFCGSIPGGHLATQEQKWSALFSTS